MIGHLTTSELSSSDFTLKHTNMKAISTLLCLVLLTVAASGQALTPKTATGTFKSLTGVEDMEFGPEKMKLKYPTLTVKAAAEGEFVVTFTGYFILHKSAVPATAAGVGVLTEAGVLEFAFTDADKRRGTGTLKRVGENYQLILAVETKKGDKEKHNGREGEIVAQLYTTYDMKG